MTIKTLNIDYSYQRLVHLTIVALLMLAGLYIYFVSTIVWDAAGREKILSQNTDLSSQVSTLEAQYVNLSGKVTLSLASSMGFSETGKESGFAMAQPTLALNNN